MNKGITTIKGELDKFGYGTIAYPNSVRNIVTKLMSNFNEFCHQPLDHKKNMLYQNGIGYENRDRIADPLSVDHKESFYIKGNYEFPNAFTPTETDSSFVESCKLLLKEISLLIEESTRALSQIAGVDLTQYFDKTSFTLRAIHYYQNPTYEIAHHHVDRGGQTYHLYETTDGLEAYWQGKWDKIDLGKDQMAYFLGIQAQYASQCVLKGLCHRVVSNRESIERGRFSLVLFVDYHKLPYKFSMAKRGPIEKAFLPGQNYEITFSELEGYFEERK